MFPTWPAKSEQGIKKANNSPKPPSGGKEYKQLVSSITVKKAVFWMVVIKISKLVPESGRTFPVYLWKFIVIIQTEYLLA